jgi:hypothetical protein
MLDAAPAPVRPGVGACHDDRVADRASVTDLADKECAFVANEGSRCIRQARRRDNDDFVPLGGRETAHAGNPLATVAASSDDSSASARFVSSSVRVVTSFSISSTIGGDAAGMPVGANKVWVHHVDQDVVADQFLCEVLRKIRDGRVAQPLRQARVVAR